MIPLEPPAPNKLFLLNAINPEGTFIEEYRIAQNKHSIETELLAYELQPISIEFKQFISQKTWSVESQILFIRQLVTLLQAGLPIINAFEMIAAEHPQQVWRCLLKEITQHLSSGLQLSEALALYPTIFPKLSIQMIAIGELTGELSQSCQRLADMQEKQLHLEYSLKKALRYPLIISAIAVMVTILMLLFVLPQFASIYESFDAELPWFTQLLLNLSDFLSEALYLIIIGTLLLIKICQWTLKKSPSTLTYLKDTSLKLPIIGELIRFKVLNQLFSSLSMTQKAGISLLLGLLATEKTLNIPCYQKAVLLIHEKISQGLLLNQTLLLHEITSLFPSICQQLIKVGEETGNLDEILHKLAIWHHQQAEEKAEKMTSSIEPFMMLIIGSIVGGLVLAMYLPIFQMGNVMN